MKELQTLASNASSNFINSIIQNSNKISLKCEMTDGNTYEFNKYPTYSEKEPIERIGDFEARNNIIAINPINNRKKRKDALAK